jgi:hypothetical protein
MKKNRRMAEILLLHRIQKRLKFQGDFPIQRKRAKAASRLMRERRSREESR